MNTNIKQTFAGDKKAGQSILHGPEQALVRFGVPRIPRGIETYHLTLMTLLWTALVLGCSVLARHDLRWLHGVSAMIALQYVTDLFDGALGRGRGTGLIKWGFYMDHFLDYIFNSAVVIGYATIAPPGMSYWFMALLVLVGGLMVNSFLSFAATNKFEIYFAGVGPTEIRLALIVLNTTLVFTGPVHFLYTVPLLCAALAIALAALAYRTHRILWSIDMAAKQASALDNESPASGNGRGRSRAESSLPVLF